MTIGDIVQGMPGIRPIYRMPSDCVGNPNLVASGTGVRDITTGRIVKSLEKAATLSPEISQGLMLAGNVASIVNLGVSVASFVYMRNAFQKAEGSLSAVSTRIDNLGQSVASVQRTADEIKGDVKASLWLLTGIADKIDHNRRTEVFAELGSVLDALSYADGADAQTARSVVQTNLIPLNKAVRLFKAFVQDAEATLAPGSFDRVETAKLAILSDVLLVKVDIILGRPDKARERAASILDHVVSLSRELVASFGSRLFCGKCSRVDTLKRAAFASELFSEPQEVILAEALITKNLGSGSGSTSLPLHAIKLSDRFEEILSEWATKLGVPAQPEFMEEDKPKRCGRKAAEKVNLTQMTVDWSEFQDFTPQEAFEFLRIKLTDLPSTTKLSLRRINAIFAMKPMGSDEIYRRSTVETEEKNSKNSRRSDAPFLCVRTCNTPVGGKVYSGSTISFTSSSGDDYVVQLDIEAKSAIFLGILREDYMVYSASLYVYLLELDLPSNYTGATPTPSLAIETVSDREVDELAELVRFCRGLQVEAQMAENDGATLQALCQRIEVPFVDNFVIGAEVPEVEAA